MMVVPLIGRGLQSVSRDPWRSEERDTNRSLTRRPPFPYVGFFTFPFPVAPVAVQPRYGPINGWSLRPLDVSLSQVAKSLGEFV